MDSVTSWNPERKVVGGAVAIILMAVAQIIWPEIELPIGVEGAVGILVAYFVPNKS